MVLNDVFTNWKSGAFFQKIEDAGVPWKDYAGAPTSVILDNEYFGNRSGRKNISPLVSAYLSNVGELDDSAQSLLASIIAYKFRENWKRLWNAYIAEYNPIHNYDMTETVTRKTTEHVADESSSTRTPDLTDATTHGMTRDEMDYRYGFNTQQSSPQPSDKIHVENGGTDTTKRTGTDKNSENSTKDGTEDEIITTSRAGNIGVTTSQKMVREERDIWVWNYFDQVFEDVDKVLTIPIYDPCKIQY